MRTRLCTNAGYRPITVDNLSTGWSGAVKFGPFERVDLLDRDKVMQVFKKYQPYAVMHLAAFSQVGESVEDPAKYWRNNVVGSLNLFEACEEREYNRLCDEFLDGGGDEDDFEDPVDWEAIDARVEAIVAGLKSKDFKEREAATLEAIDLGVDPRLVLSGQLLNNSGYRRHSERLPDLEKRARLLSAEYREVQKARPIDVVPVAEG